MSRHAFAFACLLALSVTTGCANNAKTSEADAGASDGSPARAAASVPVAHAPGSWIDPDAAALGPRSGPGDARDARDAGDAGDDAAALAERGKTLYGRYCYFCHGTQGRGYAADEAPAVGNDDLLAVASDEYLTNAIFKGRPGTTMSSWALIRGGPLGWNDAQAIVSYLRTWQKRPSEAATVDARKIEGDPTRGAATYAAHCASCHGAKGTGGKYNALANPELLASASDGFLATTIERGRASTPMTAFGSKLSKQAIEDVVALLRSWQRPPDEQPELPPKPGALVSVVMNPRGPQPAFDAKADFIPADTVKREIVERKATAIIIDARPPSDYARMHVAGSISVPFYQVAEFSKQIPKDRYILTYCACPHAESVKVRDALRALGYTRVAVIDEGMLAWRDRGYPVRGGAKP